MTNLANLLAISGIWFLSLVGLGFIARAMYEIVLLGWSFWP